MSIIDVDAQKVRQGPPDDATPEELIQRARDIVPLLVAQQEETERRTFYSEEIHRAISDAGLYLITHPKKYGGYEYDVDTFFRVVTELARGDGSAGWCYALGAGHTIAIAAYWSESVQEKVLGNGPFIAPSVSKPEGVARRVDGGWRITGTWRFCSGSPYANHFWAHTFPEGSTSPMQFLIERSAWERLDDWGDTLGLRGSGSHSIRIEDGFVPDEFALTDSVTMMFEPTRGTIGAELHGNRMYNGRPASWFTTEFSAIALGMAKAALDVFTDLMETQQTPFPPSHVRTIDHDYQLWYGQAVSKLFIAEATLDATVAHMRRKAQEGGFELYDDLLATRMAWEVEAICWEVLTIIMRAAGSSQIKNGKRIERVIRDYTQLHTHTGFLLLGDMSARDLARVKWDVTAAADMRSFKV